MPHTFLRGLFTDIIQLAFLLPFLPLCRRNQGAAKLLLLVVLYYVLYMECLRLPMNTGVLLFGKMNWGGKILAIIFSLSFYTLFKRSLVANNFITNTPQRRSLKPAIFAATILCIADVGFKYLLGNKAAFSAEILAFEITLPGIDEELAFRGILMGLLVTALPTYRFINSNKALLQPAIYITAILFAFIHSLTLNDKFHILFDWSYFTYTFIVGFIFAWITYICRSILVSIIAHNTTNFVNTIIAMLR